jgi:alanine-glyoxylate transaminase/serine-glyoxylate transaminase/serine-pyruvate transaminase
MPYQSGRHLLQIPGPTNVPDRILRAIGRPTIDHRGPKFAKLGLEVLQGLKGIFKTDQPVLIYPSSGTGAWEAALVNTLSPGDKVLMAETGQFARLWENLATRFGLNVELIPGDWRSGVDSTQIHEVLSTDAERNIKAVCIVHNETSTGVTSNVQAVRQVMDSAAHPALLMVDTISSLASMDYRHDEWCVDVTVSGSQKGLMLPPGLSFTAVSEKALDASNSSRFAKSYWRWDEMLKMNEKGFFPYTPATNMLYGLREAINMLNEEGLDNVFARHDRHAEATRSAVAAWGLEILCRNPQEYSSSLTAVLLPDGRDADAFRKLVLDNFDMSLGSGLGKVAGRIFRIGHLGDLNDLTLVGALSGVEMGLRLFGFENARGGVDAALEYLTNMRKQ